MSLSPAKKFNSNCIFQKKPDFEMFHHYSCRYKSTSNAEQHFFPSSLAFNFMCLLDFGLIHAAHLGFQRKVLLELRSQGKDDLVEPNQLYSVCLLAGLVDDDDLQNLGKLPEPDPEVTSQQRCSILTVALDHNLVDFLKSCLLHWNDGKLHGVLCTIHT